MKIPIATAEQRLIELGIAMPPAPKPLGAYTETVQSANLLFVAGTLPVLAGKLQYTGTIGRDLDVAAGQQAARLATLNSLSAVREHLGSLDRVTRVLKTEVHLVTTDDIASLQPKIADGASQLLLEIFGDKGLSVRKLISVSSIALHAPVVVELTFEIVDGPAHRP